VAFDGRLLCATCIANETAAPAVLEKKSPHLIQMTLAAAALLVIWVVFYLFGWIILQYRDTAPETSSAVVIFYCA
jgi:heme/copper-type cytochrome/quinol oxidase subunit 2